MSTQQTNSLRFAGYAALFDVPDGIKDTIVKGAFARSLQQRKEPIPLFWQHRPDQPIGVVEKAAEDKRGLQVVARLDNPQSLPASMLREKAINGLSFGYRARRYRMAETGRVLEDIELLEVSLVSHPLQHEARVHLVS
ncbi:HK97 family phage prohead protease [Erythrobacter sp. HA6-11]